MSTSTPEPTPALLLIGAMGTGKSDTPYHVFSRLYGAGIPTARLDLDDIGMCRPSPENDPDNVAVKAAAMGAAWRAFRDHGARCLMVSGGIDSPEVVEHHKQQLPDADWTVVRLRIGTEERRRRVLTRGLLLDYSEEEMEPTVDAGDADERNVESLSLPGHVIDTDGLTSQQATDLVLTRAQWPSTAKAAELTLDRLP